MEDNKNNHPPPKTRRAQVANACMKCRDAKLKVSMRLFFFFFFTHIHINTTCTQYKQYKTKGRKKKTGNKCGSCHENFSCAIQCSSTRPVCDRCLDRKLACVYDVTEGMTKRQQDRVDLLDSGEQLHRRRMLLQFLQRARIEEGIFFFLFLFLSFSFSFLFFLPPFLFVYLFLPPFFLFFFLLVMLVAKLACSFETERES